jgi:Zn ribbon nucleic-acid-binding protein|tara:strand:+ start:72 stop:386 length:315 start_codon:yes stop_codon:yes gene_type:complete
MAETLVEVPGRMSGKIGGVDVQGVGAQCPYCSKVYDEFDYEKGEKIAYPSDCKRCGSPMETGKSADEFSELKAMEEQQTWPSPEAMSLEQALKVLQANGIQLKS